MLAPQSFDVEQYDIHSSQEPNFNNPFDIFSKSTHIGTESTVVVAFEKMGFKRDADPMWISKENMGKQLKAIKTKDVVGVQSGASIKPRRSFKNPRPTRKNATKDGLIDVHVEIEPSLENGWGGVDTDIDRTGIGGGG